MIREFKLAAPGRGRGVSCDENGAFIGAIPLLQRSGNGEHPHWEPRDCGELSEKISSDFGVPVDFASKHGGLDAVCNALNEGNVARAQIAAVLLGIPDAPPLAKGVPSRDAMIEFIRNLDWYGLIKANWYPDEHPRWPAGASGGQGGRLAPKGPTTQLQIPPAATSSARIDTNQVAYHTIAESADAFGASRRKPNRKLEEQCQIQYDEDTFICNSILDKEEAAICHHSAAERYGNCLAGRQIPPLTVPDPNNRSLPAPAAPTPRLVPPRPPRWLPFVLPLPA